MMDERIEREVRAWLAAEAAGPVPERLRSRVAVARPPVAVGPFGFRRGWALVVAVVLLAVLLVGAGLFALGLLPPSPLACPDVTIDRVRAAIAASAGYSYRAEGTMLVNDIALPVRTPPADPLDHSERRIAFEGAYAAPSDWRITLLEGWDPQSLAPPELQLFINGASTLGVEGDLWATRGASPVYLRPDTRFEAILREIQPNILLALAHGADAEIGFSGGDFEWQAAHGEGEFCRLRGVNARVAALDTEAEQTVTVDAHPDTGFPARVMTDITSGLDVPDPVERHLVWTVQTGRPTIATPADPGPRPLTPEEAAGLGQAFGIPEAQLVAEAHDGNGQVMLIGDSQREAELVYVGGAELQASVGEPSESVTAYVADDGAGAAYLVITVTDPRVATVDVDLAFVPDRQVTVASVPAAFVYEVDPRVVVNRYTAFDADGNELPELSDPNLN